MRIGRAELRVMDLDEAVKYYTNIIGLEVAGRSPGGYITYPDSPTITWTEDKIAHGIFYHRRAMSIET